MSTSASPDSGISAPISITSPSDLGVMVGEGVQVERIENNSPVEKAGLRVGDVITAVGGSPVDANTSLLNLMLRFRVGQTVELSIVRDGQPETLQVTLGAFPDEA